MCFKKDKGFASITTSTPELTTNQIRPFQDENSFRCFSPIVP